MSISLKVHKHTNTLVQFNSKNAIPVQEYLEYSPVKFGQLECKVEKKGFKYLYSYGKSSYGRYYIEKLPLGLSFKAVYKVTYQYIPYISHKQTSPDFVFNTYQDAEFYIQSLDMYRHIAEVKSTMAKFEKYLVKANDKNKKLLSICEKYAILTDRDKELFYGEDVDDLTIEKKITP